MLCIIILSYAYYALNDNSDLIVSCRLVYHLACHSLSLLGNELTFV